MAVKVAINGKSFLQNKLFIFLASFCIFPYTCGEIID